MWWYYFTTQKMKYFRRACGCIQKTMGNIFLTTQDEISISHCINRWVTSRSDMHILCIASILSLIQVSTAYEMSNDFLLLPQAFRVPFTYENKSIFSSKGHVLLLHITRSHKGQYRQANVHPYTLKEFQKSHEFPLTITALHLLFLKFLSRQGPTTKVQVSELRIGKVWHTKHLI